MIRLHLSADALATVRFAVSPVMETVVAVKYRWFMSRSARHETPWARAVSAPEVWRHLPLLSKLLRDVGVPVPEVPAAGLPGPGIGQLGQEVSAAAPMFADVLKTFLQGVCLTERFSPRARAVWDEAVSQDPTCAERIADELERFYRLSLAPHWSAIEEQAQADIARRAGIIARRGLGFGLASLHPTVTFRDGTLRIDHEAELDMEWDKEITLAPSTLAHEIVLCFDPHKLHSLCLAYPVLRLDEGRDPRAGAEVGELLGNVLGHTRLTLLCGLGQPRTTSQLAARYHLSPSTVSYHLTRLFRAGLLTRSRDGVKVYYLRTAKADRLLSRARA